MPDAPTNQVDLVADRIRRLVAQGERDRLVFLPGLELGAGSVAI